MMMIGSKVFQELPQLDCESLKTVPWIRRITRDKKPMDKISCISVRWFRFCYEKMWTE